MAARLLEVKWLVLSNSIIRIQNVILVREETL